MRDIMSSRMKIIVHENYVCKEVLMDWLNGILAREDKLQDTEKATLESVRRYVDNMPYISIKERID